MDKILKQLPKLAKDKHNENKKYFSKLQKKPPKDLDYQMQEIHTAVFKKQTVYLARIVVKQQGLFLLVQISSESVNTCD